MQCESVSLLRFQLLCHRSLSEALLFISYRQREITAVRLIVTVIRIPVAVIPLRVFIGVVVVVRQNEYASLTIRKMCNSSCILKIFIYSLLLLFAASLINIL